MSQNTDETVIELSKTKIILTIVGSAVFVAIGIWLLTINAADISQGRSFRLFFNSPLFARALGVLSIAFFGLTGIFGIRKFFDKRPGLILDSSGITDNASAAAAGFIPWSDVIGFDVFEMNKSKMLVVMVGDPEKYIDRGNAVKRKLNKANFNMVGSPISISSVTLATDFADLQSLFRRYLDKYAPVPNSNN
jgi:hypothetical protein